MMRLIRLGCGALLAIAALGASGHSTSAATAFDIGSANSYFSGFVTKGPDAGAHLEGLLSLTAGAGNVTMGDGSTATASTGKGTSGITLTVTLANGMVNGMGSSIGNGMVAGSFTGPKAGDQGIWTTSVATMTVDYAVTGSITNGPHTGQQLLIGDLFAYITADGTLFGKYVDNSKSGPGITPKVYPVHGTFMNNMMSAGIMFSPRTSYALVGRAGKSFGLNRVLGYMVGPSSRDYGTWAGLDNSSPA